MGILTVEADDALILSLSRSEDSDQKKRANTINLLSWKSLLSLSPIVQLTVVFFQIICCRLAEETTTKNLSRKSRLDSFVLPAPVTVVTLFRGTQRQFLENICSEDDLRSRIFGTFVVKFLACMPLLGFSNLPKMV